LRPENKNAFREEGRWLGRMVFLLHVNQTPPLRAASDQTKRTMRSGSFAVERLRHRLQRNVARYVYIVKWKKYFFAELSRERWLDCNTRRV